MEEGRRDRRPSSFRALALGFGLAALYVGVLAVTIAVTNRPVRPLFDGLTPPPPYRWVKPPPGWGFNTKPGRDDVTVPLSDAGSEPAGPTAVNGQVVLNLPAGAIPPRPGDTAVKVTITPLDPGRLGALPPGLVPDGNAYEIRMRSRPSGAVIPGLAAAGNVVLGTPEPASVLLFSGDGRRWQILDTQRVGGPDSVGGSFRLPGHYLAAIPGPTRPAATSRPWLETGRKVLIGVLSLLLAANLALRARQSRRADRGT